MGFANMKSAEMSEFFYADEIKALRLSLCKRGVQHTSKLHVPNGYRVI